MTGNPETLHVTLSPAQVVALSELGTDPIPPTPRERPILFSGPMVRPILEGRKTQTRRVMNPQPHKYVHSFFFLNTLNEFKPMVGGPSHLFELPEMKHGSPTIRCPYGVPGDRLWVKEAWRTNNANDDLRPSSLPAGSPLYYEADCSDWQGRHSFIGKRRASRFMPRWASRITLEITEVRAQRVQDISDEDAIAEGTRDPTLRFLGGDLAQTAWLESQVFRIIWDSINAQRGYAWEKNPWVWATTFRRIS